MRDTRAYACSSNTNGGRHLCANEIRVNREIAESVVLCNIKNRLLSPEATRYIKQQTKKALKQLERRQDDGESLKDRIRVIDTKLSKIGDAIEAVGISDTLAERLSNLEREKIEAEEGSVTSPLV